MPAFVEAALRHMGKLQGKKGDDLDSFVWGAMNHMGVVHGNKITPKGEAIEKRETGDSMVAKTAALIPRRKRDVAG